MSAKATQNQVILAAFKAGKHLTNTSARELCGTERFSARVKDLRNAGYMIGDTWREGTNRYGNKTRYKEYWLVRIGDEG